MPRKIIHDRAAEFLSDVLQDTASIMGLTQLPTSGGHPQTDGLVERLNRKLNTYITVQQYCHVHSLNSTLNKCRSYNQFD